MEKFIKEHDYPISLEYGKYADRPYDSPEVWGDNSKISRIMEVTNECQQYRKFVPVIDSANALSAMRNRTGMFTFFRFLSFM